MNFDPVRLEIFKNLFHSVAEEMGGVLRRSALNVEQPDGEAADADVGGEGGSAVYVQRGEGRRLSNPDLAVWVNGHRRAIRRLEQQRCIVELVDVGGGAGVDADQDIPVEVAQQPDVRHEQSVLTLTERDCLTTA